MGPAGISFFKKGATQIDKSKYQEENGWKPFACEGACETNHKSAQSHYTPFPRLQTNTAFAISHCPPLSIGSEIRPIHLRHLSVAWSDQYLNIVLLRSRQFVQSG